MAAQKRGIVKRSMVIYVDCKPFDKRSSTIISREEIDLAYRAVLGREAESDAVYEAWNKICSNFTTLIAHFAASTEAITRRSTRPVSADTNLATQSRILDLLRMLRVSKLVHGKKIRVGRDNDGGYVMLDAFEKVSKAYSLGISDDISWDLAIAERCIDIFQYDHTISALPAEHERFHWSKIGIEGSPSPAAELDTLAGLIVRNAHEQENDLLLKCDIEGSEWEMLAEVSIDTLNQFRQIIIEIHISGDLRDESYYDLVVRAARNLTKSHCVVHVHGNNCAPYEIICGIPIPAVIELTLLRRDAHCIFEESDETFPTAIDMPNSAHHVDLQLGTFRF